MNRLTHRLVAGAVGRHQHVEQQARGPRIGRQRARVERGVELGAAINFDRGGTHAELVEGDAVAR